MQPLRRAVLSVFDKRDLDGFAKRLAAMGVELVSTGGTSKALQAAGLTVSDVASLTGFPEMLDGRVKTLHPAIHGGLLADMDNAAHASALDGAGIAPIGLLVSNLYPFEAALSDGRSYADLVETIDVGGPTMTRAAAKNHSHVIVIVDPEDYGPVADALEAGNGTVPEAMRKTLAAKAFARLASYDAAIAGWLGDEADKAAEEAIDHRAYFAIGGRKTATMRYGENPHQNAALYGALGGDGLAGAKPVQGKALSYNNIADADAAFAAAADFTDDCACVIVKHANPCGIAVAGTPGLAYRAAFRCDTVSAFGGVVALTRPLDEDAAKAVAAVFTEVLIAPSASPEALAILSAKTNLRILLTGEDAARPSRMIHTVSGGFLVQDTDTAQLDENAVSVVTKRAPTDQEWRDLRFAWRAIKHVKSNAILFAKDGATVGVGAGQMSRVDAARIATWKAADAARDAGEDISRTVGSVAASDAFFPFPDGLEVIAEAGATAVIQPGGSRRDGEVIAAADKHGIAMVTTGMRHFRH